MYEKEIQQIIQLAGGINDHAMRELMRLLKLAELNGIEQGIRTAKDILTKLN